MLTSKISCEIEKLKIEENFINLSNSQNSQRQSEKQETKSKEKASINPQKQGSSKNLIVQIPLFSCSSNILSQKTKETKKEELFFQHKRNNTQNSDVILTCHQCGIKELCDYCLICNNINCKYVYCYSCL